MAGINIEMTAWELYKQYSYNKWPSTCLITLSETGDIFADSMEIIPNEEN